MAVTAGAGLAAFIAFAPVPTTLAMALALAPPDATTPFQQLAAAGASVGQDADATAAKADSSRRRANSVFIWSVWRGGAGDPRSPLLGGQGDAEPGMSSARRAGTQQVGRRRAPSRRARRISADSRAPCAPAALPA